VPFRLPFPDAIFPMLRKHKSFRKLSLGLCLASAHCHLASAPGLRRRRGIRLAYGVYLL
jgi:hypothetical protein